MRSTGTLRQIVMTSLLKYGGLNNRGDRGAAGRGLHDSEPGPEAPAREDRKGSGNQIDSRKYRPGYVKNKDLTVCRKRL